MDIIKTLTGLINDVDNNDIDSLKDLYLELIHLRSELQDINYTRCCCRLKSKYTPEFEEWLLDFDIENNMYVVDDEQKNSKEEMHLMYMEL